MDNFGIFTESFGLKPQGKSAPMASSKRSQNSVPNNGSFSNDVNPQNFQNFQNSDVFGANFDPILKNFNGSGGLRSSSMPNNYNNHVYDNGDDNYDIFGGMPGLKTSSSSVNYQNDDFFASFGPGPKQNGDPIDDLLGNLGGNKSRSNSLGGKNSNGFDDLIPGFGGKSPSANGGKADTRRSTTVHPSKSAPTLFEDPFVVLEHTSTPSNASFDVFSDPLEELGRLSNSGKTKLSQNANEDPFDIFTSSVSTNGSQSSNGSMKTPNNYSAREIVGDEQIRIPKIPPFKPPTNGSLPSKPPSYKPSQVSKPDKVKSLNVSSIGEFEEFAKGKVRNNSAMHATSLKDATERFEVKFKQAKELRERKANASRDRETTEGKKDNKKNSEDGVESVFSSRSRSAPRPRTSTADNEMGAKVGHRTPLETPSSIKKVTPVINIVDDLASIFGADMSGGQFEEVEGESEERRIARWERFRRTNDRIAQAMADMNQRDLQLQREQEEKHRISETLDCDIKRWAAGKEGNLRALLSSLQYVLWSESGWQAISLTDIITSASVKKVYRKANLCIHPDKVQQKGANIEQKYVAGKVFDILQEAWNKFNKEELS